MNFVRGRLRRHDGTVWVDANDGVRLPIDSNHGGQDGQEVVYSFRPEHSRARRRRLGHSGQDSGDRTDRARTRTSIASSAATQICAVFGERLALKPGETLWLQPKGEAVHVFDSATGKVLS